MNNGQILASVLGTALLSVGILGVVSSVPSGQTKPVAQLEPVAEYNGATTVGAPAPVTTVALTTQKHRENDGKETIPYDGKETIPYDGKEVLGKEVLPVQEGPAQGLMVDAAPIGPPTEHQYIPPTKSSPLLSPPTPVNVSGPTVSPDIPTTFDIR